MFWDAIRRGQSGTRAITDFDASTYPCKVAAPVPPVDISSAMALDGELGPRETRADPRRYSRAALFGVLAAREAWNDAGLSFAEPNAGVIIGSGGGGIDVGERQYQDFFQNNGQHVTPYAIAVGICGMVSSEISIALGLRGISHVLSTGCTSSTDALGYAAMLLRQGECDVLLSGGTDGCVLPGMIFGFSRMRAVSTHYNDRAAEASRPFDRGRDGFVLGEGAWMMALELEDRARARGAQIYATIEGYASTCDAYHRVQMDPDGEQIVKCMHDADRQVGTRAGRDRLHQLSRHLDAAERRDRIAMHAAGVRHARRAHSGLVDQVDDRPSAGRQRLGRRRRHRAGAVARTSCRRRSTRPSPDPDCDLDFIPNQGRDASPVAALCNCLGFGSKNSALWSLARASPMDDVAIAGAGPAGALAAAILARAGLRVSVFDRARFPRHKLCGDTLNPGALAVIRPSRRRDVARRRAAIRSTACC